MTRLAIYSRPGCHLCDEMKSVVSAFIQELPPDTITVEHIDISTDAALNQLYGEEIPVLLIDGRKAAKYRITVKDLRQRLKQLTKSDL